MSVDQHRQHAKRLIVFNKPHPAHIGGEIIDVRYALRGSIADVCEPKVAHHVFGLRRSEIPIVQSLLIYGPYRHTLGQQIANELTTNKPSGPSYERQLRHS